MPGIRPYKDLTGQSRGILYILGAYCHYPRRKRNETYWNCICKCGKEVGISHSVLVTTRRIVKSCGCLSLENRTKANTKHGKSGTRVFSIWKGAAHRCNDPKSSCYKYYGGRGIKFNFSGFVEFESYLLSLYPNLQELMDKGYELDRIDNNGNYEPGNIRLITEKENKRNRSDNCWLSLFGKTMTLAEAMELGICKVGVTTVGRRLKRGWSGEESLLLPKFPGMGSWDFKEWKAARFPNDITLEEALAPVLLPILAMELKTLATMTQPTGG